MFKYRNIAIVGALALAAPLAHAQQQSIASGFTVQTTVTSSCSFSAAPSNLDFGNYFAGNTATTNTTGSATLTCTLAPGTPLAVWIATQGPRQMTNASNATLNYDIFTQLNGQTSFPNAAPTATNFAYGNAPLTIQYFGRVTAGQFVTAGPYQQTATLNVRF